MFPVLRVLDAQVNVRPHIAERLAAGRADRALRLGEAGHRGVRLLPRLALQD